MNKYVDFAREMKRLWNMKVTVIPIEFNAVGTISKAWKGDWMKSKSEQHKTMLQGSIILKQKSIIRNNETFNYIISECSKLPQREYETRLSWVRKRIHWELYKRSEFDRNIQWYIHKPESGLEKRKHKILWDFEIPKDHLIPARRQVQVIISKNQKKKKKERERDLPYIVFCRPSEPLSENQRKLGEKDKY